MTGAAYRIPERIADETRAFRREAVARTAIAIGILLALALAGCGGGEGERASAIAVVVRWHDAPSQGLVRADSIRLEVLDQVSVHDPLSRLRWLGSQVINRPAPEGESTATFAVAGSGPTLFLVKATLYPEPGAAGSPLVEVMAPVTSQPGGSAPVAFATSGPVERIDLMAIGPYYVFPGDWLLLVGTPRDSTGAVVPARLAWTPAQPSVATVDDAGIARAIIPGSTLVTVTEPVSGVKSYTTVCVWQRPEPPEEPYRLQRVKRKSPTTE